MSRNAVFTVVAKNYTGLGQVLGHSVKKNCGADFFIVVADTFDAEGQEKANLPTSVISAKDITGYSVDDWEDMSFKYGLVEFCTAIKPACFQYFFQQGYDKVIYLDPDVYVFNGMEHLFSKLDNYSILLTPHIIDMAAAATSDHPDYLFLVNGTYNLGFLALRSSAESDKLLSWWRQRMQNQCFFDNDRGMATDQKWFMLLPSFFEPSQLLICRDAGINMAPWNFNERKLLAEDGQLLVANRFEQGENFKTPLTFIHFSGYDYQRMSTDNSIVYRGGGLTEYKDLKAAFDIYSKALIEGGFNTYFHLPYSYNQFSSGKNILNLHRRIYRRMVDEGKAIKHPFAEGPGTYYDLLRRKKLLDKSAVSGDKMTLKSMGGGEGKLKKINFLFKLLFKVMGVRKYSMFIRFLKRYAKDENQAFLAEKEWGRKLW